MDTFPEQVAIAKQYGLELVAYEGGPAYDAYFGSENDDRINKLFDASEPAPRMGKLYIELLNAWKAAGGKAFVNFNSCGRFSKWGRWGLLEYIAQQERQAAKYDSVLTFISRQSALVVSGRRAQTYLGYLVDYLWVPVAFGRADERWRSQRGHHLIYGGHSPAARNRFVQASRYSGEFGKQEIISLWIAVGVVLFHRDRVRAFRLRRAQKICIAGLTLGVLATILTNGDGLKWGPTLISGHELYDTVHFVSWNVFNVILPFGVGAVMFRTSRELRLLLVTLVGAVLLYSFFKSSNSESVHSFIVWCTVFISITFVQTMRAGGFRPMVFMSHGLAVSFAHQCRGCRFTWFVRARKKIGSFSGLVTVATFGCCCRSPRAWLP